MTDWREYAMATNLERFRKDLDRLISQGERLEFLMLKEVMQGDKLDELIRKQVGAENAKAFLKDLPDLHEDYEAWYSESLALLRQILPDRVSNFIGLYEKPKGRKSIDYGNYVMQDFLQGLQVTLHGKVKVDMKAALPQYTQQLAILKAAKTRFESSLFEIRQILQADIFDSEISAARELMKHNYLRAAGTIAGVVLEKHLRQVCDDHSVTITKGNPGIGDLNELLKANSIIDVPQWRYISMLGDIRNLCSHNKHKEPTIEHVTDLIDGTDKVLKTVV
ncbi:MAG: hypothetical protein PHU25_07115 [Deltaproteobacteria bacterium]|nr:hypothetical protein [Deltaproteobacteria bacterium]